MYDLCKICKFDVLNSGCCDMLWLDVSQADVQLVSEGGLCNLFQNF